MNKDEILLSVIIAVKNGEQYLEDCIKSIINNYDSKKCKIEIIVINDNSTDKTLQVLEELSKKNKILKFSNSSGKGVSDARNCGLQLASGKYVVFFDADDYVDENFKKAIELLDGETELYLFDILFETSSSKKLIVNYPENICSKNLKFEDREYLKLCKLMNNGPVNKIVKKEFLVKNEIYFKRFSVAEDMEWTIRLMINKPCLFISNFSYYHYVKHEASVMNSANFTRTKEAIDACKEALKNINTSILPNKYKKALKRTVINTQYSTLQYYKKMNKEDRVLFKKYIEDYQAWLGIPSKPKFWLIRACLLFFGLDFTLFLMTKFIK